MWYAFRMTTQLAVRLPEEMVRAVDKAVADGLAPNRSRLIRMAIDRELRHLAAVRDYEILRDTEPDKEMEALAQWTSQQFRTNPNWVID